MVKPTEDLDKLSKELRQLDCGKEYMLGKKIVKFILSKMKKAKPSRVFLFKALIIVVSILSFIVSLGVWGIIFKDKLLLELITKFQVFYLITIGFYFLILSFKSNFLFVVLKIFLRLLFGVWVIIFILLSTQDNFVINAWIINCTFFIVYFEAFFEIHHAIQKSLREASSNNKTTLLVRNYEILISQTAPLTVLLVSLLHALVPLAAKYMRLI